MKTRRKSGDGAKRVARSADGVQWAPDADCTITHVRAMKTRLARLLTTRSCVTLDLSTVRRVDTAGMQVLAAFVRDRAAAGRPVECRGASESLRETVRVLGLAALFDCAGTGPAATP